MAQIILGSKIKGNAAFAAAEKGNFCFYDERDKEV
jgi:hypothetical protein